MLVNKIEFIFSKTECHDIVTIARVLCEKARDYKAEASTVFNGVRLTAQPASDWTSLVDRYNEILVLRKPMQFDAS